MSATIRNAIDTLANGDFDTLSTMLVADLAEHGVADAIALADRAEPADGYRVGDLVAIYAHQRYRIARVWKVGRTKVSAVYVTPSECDAAARTGRKPYPNNITAEPASLIVRGSQPAEVPAPVAGGPAVPVASAPAFHCGMLPIGADLEGALF